MKYLRNTVHASVAVFYIGPGNGQTEAPHLGVIRESIQRQLSIQVQGPASSATPNFVIIDGFDELSNHLQDALKGEFSLPSSKVHRTLLTRRVPQYEQPAKRDCNFYYCDGSNCDQMIDVSRQLFWRCEDCHAEQPYRFILCSTCCGEGEGSCPNPSHVGHLVEPYGYRNLDVAQCVPQDYIREDLKREYGESNIPPNAVETLLSKSVNNITIAKLRLDHARYLPSLQDLGNMNDRLPRGVVAFYDSEIGQIHATNEDERTQLLMAMVAATKFEFLHCEKLERFLWNSAQQKKQSALSVEDILRLSRGLLCMVFDTIRTYHRDFFVYVLDDYNKDLMEAKQRLEVATSSTENGIALAQHRIMTRSTHQTSAASENPATTALSRVRTAFEDQSIETSLAPETKNKARRFHKTPTQITSVCSFCETTILENTSLQGLHHRSETELKTSSDCIICISILKYATTNTILEKNTKTTTTSVESPQFPLIHMDIDKLKHRWSIRTTGPPPHTTTVLTLHPAHLPPGTSSRRYHFTPIAKNCHKISSSVSIPPSTHLHHISPQIKAWLDACAKHEYCERRTQTYIPKRLVEIDSASPSKVRVVLTANHLHNTTPYATLSHCWGKKPFIKLTRNSERELSNGIDIQFLNVNFQQAIEVAREIKMRYIWIDSLCIMQDADGDFSTEGDFMHAVYRNSYCNIVAADSRDSTGGLFRPQNVGIGSGEEGEEDDRQSILPRRYSSGQGSVLGEGEWSVMDEELWQDGLLSAPIYARGWVFQGKLICPLSCNNTQGTVKADDT